MLNVAASLTGTIVFIGLRSYLWLRPAAVSEMLKSFSNTYPLIRLAGEKQHIARTGFVKLLGALFIILGIAPLLGIVLKILR